MSITGLYEMATSESDDGTEVPIEALWTPPGDDAVAHGFVAHRRIYVAGITSPADDSLYPQVFIFLGKSAC